MLDRIDSAFRRYGIWISGNTVIPSGAKLAKLYKFKLNESTTLRLAVLLRVSYGGWRIVHNSLNFTANKLESDSFGCKGAREKRRVIWELHDNAFEIVRPSIIGKLNIAGEFM